ncbi:MAG: sucrose-6-phosphate hydrolase [Cardiobacteriaceae bacterium]|nr:sucrose-6-phosphate hydrolase [Cardiobacteriaceae bacterium]
MNWSRDERYTALNSITQARYETLCEQVAASIWRQRFHIQPPAGLLNDPNGFCYHQNTYHLFYQWFPLGPVHGLKYWYHLTSPDLIQFHNHGSGIAPDSEWDSHGAYSGSALSDDNQLLIAYTGNHRTADWTRIPYQMIAHMDNHNRLHKSEPFLKGALAGYTEHVRDPKIWREADGTYGIVLGAQRHDQTGTALYLTSQDTQHWRLHGEIDFGLQDFGYMWECPDYFALAEHDVFLCCPQGLPADGDSYRNIYQSGYFIGHFDKSTYHFQHHGFHELDHGFDFYAPQTCLGANSERLLIGWMGLPDTSCPSAKDGWAHCLTLPRILSIENDRLRQRPLPALKQHRGNGAHDGVHYELILQNPSNHPFILTLRASDKEYTRITYNGEAIIFDRSHSGALPEPEKEISGKGGHIRRLAIGELHTLQLYSDTCSLEIFINDGEAVMTGNIYPQENATGLDIATAPDAIVTIYPLT